MSVSVNRKNYDYLRETRKRINLLYGGAGSGKSWSIAQFFVIEKMCKEIGIRILVTRKTGPALTKSCWQLVLDLLRKYEIPFECNKTDKTIVIGTAEMWFVPLDDPEKIKSIEGINYVWAEEATELTQWDFMQLDLRCRGFNPQSFNFLVFSFNPIQKPGIKYLQNLTKKPTKNVGVCHSTWRDNQFLSKEYTEQLENLHLMDKTYDQIYNLGEWALASNTIFTNWDIWTDKWPKFDDFDYVGYGLDFGFNAPCALVEIGIKGMETWERELIYQTKLTNDDLIDLCASLMIDRGYPLVADSAEPDRIQEFRMAGFNVWPCLKNKDSVRLGIDRIKRYSCHFHRDSTNLIHEAEVYKWKETPDGEPLDIPVDFCNHLMDARRYFIGMINTGGLDDVEIVEECYLS